MSTSALFDRVKHISQPKKDIVFGFIRECQQFLPKNNAYYNIPSLIKYLSVLYYNNIINSSILTDDEEHAFISLMEKYNKFKELGPNYSWNLIYKGSRDGYKNNTVYEHVHFKKNIVIIVKSRKGNIFGGYTSVGWQDVYYNFTDGYKQISDDKAFLFSIKCKGSDPFIMNIRKDKIDNALLIYFTGSCLFGEMGYVDFYLDDDFNVSLSCCSAGYTYQAEETKKLNGGDGEFYVQEIEAFQLIN